MSEDGGRRERHGTVDDAEIGMTNAAVPNANKNLAGAWIVDLDPFDHVQSPPRLRANPPPQPQSRARGADTTRAGRAPLPHARKPSAPRPCPPPQPLGYGRIATGCGRGPFGGRRPFQSPPWSPPPASGDFHRPADRSADA